MENMTVDEYRARSREFEIEEARKGMIAHSAVTVAVVSLLTVINLTLTPEFLWFIFPLAGMSAGLAVHYLLGYRYLGAMIRMREKRIEEWR